MRIILKIFFSVFLIFVFTSEVYSRCLEYDDSFKKHVLKARELLQKGKSAKAVEEYKEHLKCFEDKEIALELGKFYESKQKFYLAGLVYNETNLTEEFNKLEQKRIKNIDPSKYSNFKDLSEVRSNDFLKRYKVRKAFSTTFYVIGSVSLATGLGLFLYSNAWENVSLAAQYSLMLGGLTFLDIGITLNLSSIYEYERSKAYKGIAGMYDGDSGTIPDEYYQFSGTESQTKKTSAKMFRKHGAALMLMSIPLLAISIYGFYDIYKYYDKKYGGGSGLITFSAYFGYVYSLGPAILSFIGGSILLYKGYQWEKLRNEPISFTLNSITPMINPVSKTYGLALGFSF